MRRINQYHFLLLTLSLYCASAPVAKEPDMFLCIDSMLAIRNSTGKEPKKLVYGYVDGQKTACMSEYELRVIYSREQFVKDSTTIDFEQQKTLSRNAVFRGGKDLANADFRGMDLQGVDLSGANLENAQLESVDFRNANLSGANLRGANLKGAYCKNVNFCKSNLTEADLQGAFFQNAEMNNVEGITSDQLCKAATLYRAKFDQILLEELETHYASKLEKPKGEWVPKDFGGIPSPDTEKNGGKTKR